METGRKAGGVLVVERGDGSAFARAFLPAIVELADHGLRGDRAAVLESLRRIRTDLRLERTAFDAADIGDVVEKLDLVMQRAVAEAEAERAGRPAKIDILQCLRTAGTISHAEYLAGLELRAVGEAIDCAIGGAPAIDYTRERVDGGKGWSEPELAGGGVHHPAAKRVLEWARYVDANSPPVGGRSKRTPLQVIWTAVGRNVPLRDIDRTSGCRKGTTAKVVKAGLGLYVAMGGASCQNVLDTRG
ncbi:hypothetical protein [Azospirillum picis]|uniref:Uncharacterized protein n=1 Tax=Azospirillum picis TaxID=488438 RepID=A0ABU0MUH8_9PROT|nr:hypothetical protein [Azospirillum picis]MBP2303314.1 hypothetical protein [Azospirillum picis]MDQ0537146.1 hypothetical protein [Azospirillum picis]